MLLGPRYRPGDLVALLCGYRVIIGDSDMAVSPPAVGSKHAALWQSLYERRAVRRIPLRADHLTKRAKRAGALCSCLHRKLIDLHART